jgi:hypothetical protein
MSSSSAWAALALASGDAAFRTHVASRLSDPDRSRARTRLSRHGLLDLLPRLRGRCTVRRFAIGAEPVVDFLRDARLVLAGPTAARALGWPLPEGTWPVDAYVPQAALVPIVEHYDLEPDPAGDLLLRSVPEPWPFPPHTRVVPELVAALDLAGGVAAEVAALGRARLVELTAAVEPVWYRRPRRPRSVRPLIPSAPHRPGSSRRRVRAPRCGTTGPSATHAALVALLFLVASPLRRAEAAEALRTSPARLNRACAFRRAPPEPLSQAALEVLAIVAYEQPVSRADISQVRGTDSSGVVDTLLARGLIAVDPRFGAVSLFGVAPLAGVGVVRHSAPAAPPRRAAPGSSAWGTPRSRAGRRRCPGQ